MDDLIMALENGAMERWRHGDPGGFVDISADDITYCDPSLACPIIGLDAFRDYMKKAEGFIYYDRSEFLNPKIVRVGDAALLTYNYRSSVLGNNGQVVKQTLWNTTEVYLYKQDQWRISHTHWSFVDQQLPGIVKVPIRVHTPAREYTGEMAEIMQLESKAMERWRQGDPWGFIEISDPDVTYFDTGTAHRLDGIDILKAEYQTREGKIFYDVMDFIELSLQVIGDMAVLFYRFLSTKLNHDGSISSRIPWNCTEIYQRRDDLWRIIHTHWSFIHGEERSL